MLNVARLKAEWCEMKKRKFAQGGDIQTFPYEPDPGYPSPPMEPSFPSPITPPSNRPAGNNTARGGLEQVGVGAKAVGSALDDIQSRIGGGGGGFGGSGTSPGMTMKRGGAVKGYAKGGMVGSASKRGDGIAQRGKTKGRVI